MKLSQSVQDYLKAILILSEGGAAVTSDIAERLGVSPASVTGMLKKLAQKHLVKYERHRGVELTTAGRKIALEMLRHHRLIELYLAEALGYAWDEVHDEAEKLEHHISEEFEDRIAKVLGDPKYDPHGDPIPSKDGIVPPTATHPLFNIATNTTVTIRRVNSNHRPLLRQLGEAGITIGAEVTVMSRNERDSTMTIRKNRSRITLSIADSQQIFVE
jgi:DtxR family Mn-dependent transcriptional regulator